MRLSPSQNGSFARSLLSTATLLALGHSALAYEFTPPPTPSLPTNLPGQNFLIDSSATANPGTSNPASNWKGYGPTSKTASNHDIHVSITSECHYVFGG